MLICRTRGRVGRDLLAAAGAFLLAGCLGSLAASAGQCPARAVVADGQGQKMNPAKAAGVTDSVLQRIDLANEPVGLKQHALRLRRLVVQPGGIVPWHSHTDRPAIIIILSGTITEYRSTCTVPIVHRAGDSTIEVKNTSHWWRNNTRRPVILLSADLFHDSADPHMM
ncbi:MAG: cupin domain-containing protein [Hyphomicrobiaceae bacterium]|nr:cupin domain-containing protein [Hyphomicrobiaceae bacterium]